MAGRQGKKYIQERTNDSTKQPVTTDRLPVIKCSICKRKMAYKPDKTTGQEVLQEHCKKVHNIG